MHIIEGPSCKKLKISDILFFFAGPGSAMAFTARRPLVADTAYPIVVHGAELEAFVTDAEDIAQGASARDEIVPPFPCASRSRRKPGKSPVPTRTDRFDSSPYRSVSPLGQGIVLYPSGMRGRHVNTAFRATILSEMKCHIENKKERLTISSDQRPRKFSNLPVTRFLFSVEMRFRENSASLFPIAIWAAHY